MLVFNTMLLKGNSENGTFSVAVFGVIYTMSTIPGAMFDGAGAVSYTHLDVYKRQVYGYASGEISSKAQEDTEEIEVILADREEVKRILKMCIRDRSESIRAVCWFHAYYRRLQSS